VRAFRNFNHSGNACFAGVKWLSVVVDQPYFRYLRALVLINPSVQHRELLGFVLAKQKMMIPQTHVFAEAIEPFKQLTS